MDEPYREPSWRGVLGTLIVTILVIGGLVLLASYFLGQACDPGTVNCVTPSVPPPAN